MIFSSLPSSFRAASFGSCWVYPAGLEAGVGEAVSGVLAGTGRACCLERSLFVACSQQSQRSPIGLGEDVAVLGEVGEEAPLHGDVHCDQVDGAIVLGTDRMEWGW